MNLKKETLRILESAAENLQSGFQYLPSLKSQTLSSEAVEILQQVAEGMQHNYPYHHPMYLGQMLKPPHPIAHLAYSLAMDINPNNHALDGGRASSELEKESVRRIALMFGWNDALGHLCGGGTIANLEALWVARELTQGQGVAVSEQAHYTHSRCSAVLGVKCHTIPCDEIGRMDSNALRDALQVHQIGTVVVTLGTTGLGAVDPLEEVLKLQEEFGFRIHIDSAYGGYYKLVENLAPETARQYSLMHLADSIVIDPHKHGLQPYGCGCVIFKDHAPVHVYKHDSPYTYFSSDQLHLGEISLECSRAGAAAVALWATLELFPLKQKGEFAKSLESSRTAALMLHEWLMNSEFFTPIVEPELDIVVWCVRGERASDSSAKAKQIFEEAAQANLHLALIKIPVKLAQSCNCIRDWDQDELTCLRACVMKPEHQEWMPKILKQLEVVTERVL